MAKYGYFDDAAREYVVTRPDTPLPWLNYLGQDDLFGLCTNTGGGYTFWRDARLRRLTRYRYNDVPYDSVGRYLYVRDGDDRLESGLEADEDAARSLRVPARARLQPDPRREGRRRGRVALLRPARRERGDLEDDGPQRRRRRRRRLSLFSYVEFCFYEALNDLSNYQRTYSIGEVEVEGSAIYHTTEYRERRDHYVLFGCTREIDGFDTSRDAFVGVHNGLHEAAVPFAGAPHGSVAHGWNPIGSHQLDLRLAPGEEETFAFVLAYVEQGDAPKFERPGVANKERGRALLARYSEPGAVDDGVRVGTHALGRPARALPGRVPRPARRADARHLEPVPVHGDVQPLALGELLRDAGSAAAWASATRTRTCSVSST